MSFLKRFGFYFIGLVLGVPLVFFIWKGKQASFDYGPDARVLKQIRIRKRAFSDNAKKVMVLHKVDTAQISKIISTGDVNFSKSKARKKPCGEFYVTSDNIDLYIVRCDSIATIDSVFVRK